MGWTGTEITPGRRMGAKDILRQEFSEDFMTKLVDVAKVGSTIYGAFEHDGRIVGLVVLTSRENGWLYTKPMDEDMGPAESDCPARILDKLTPTDHEYAQAWRERCRFNLARRANSKLAKGARVRFTEPLSFTRGYGSASLFEYIGRGTQFMALTDDGAYRFTARLGRDWFRRDFEKIAA